MAASTAVVDILANERDRQIAADTERTTQVDTFASGGQVQPLPEFIQDIVSKNTQKDKDKQAAIAAAAANREKKAAARRAEIARQALKDSQAAAARAQAASEKQAAKAIAKAKATLAKAAGRDRGGPSERELNAAREVLSQIDTFDSGGIMTETQRAMRDVGYGGGFAAGRGDTGATGQGGWT
jgi:thioredoxin-like negative regulator of GroEL